MFITVRCDFKVDHSLLEGGVVVFIDRLVANGWNNFCRREGEGYYWKVSIIVVDGFISFIEEDKVILF
jgi:hypothetical protein